MSTDIPMLNLDFSKLLVVDINLIRANTWNPKDRDTKEYKEVLESIRVNGLKGFISVREHKQDTALYEILDGEQRWRSCKELGFEKVIIYNEGIVSDKRAMELTLWWQTQAPFNQVSLAQLIARMIDNFGEIQTPYSQKKIDEMLKLTKFDWESYKLDSQSTLPPSPDGLLKSFMVQVTEEQYTIITDALTKVKKQTESDITDARALELLCADYLAGE